MESDMHSSFSLISDPRRGCYMGLSTFIFFLLFFFFFFRHDFVRAISLEPLLAETPNSVCCLVLRSNCALLLTIQFTSLFFFFFFYAKILSGPYLWNRYLQRLQIECAAWSCSLILHCCLPSNSLRYFFFRHDFFFFFSATILSGPFASLISSLINIISLLLTTFDWAKVWGIAPRSHTG